jgi:hypothetical protein
MASYRAPGGRYGPATAAHDGTHDPKRHSQTNTRQTPPHAANAHDTTPGRLEGTPKPKPDQARGVIGARVQYGLQRKPSTPTLGFDI